jgi:hypothetical protein
VTNIPNPEAHRKGKKDWSQRRFFSGVPQGSPTSGAVCNLVADFRLDSKILPKLEYWNTQHNLEGASKWVYTRYADDMTFSCGIPLSVSQRKEFTKDMITLIRRAGYEINPTKTRYSQNGKRRHLLGMTFNQRPNYRADKYAALRCLTFNCAKHGFASQFERAGFKTAYELSDWLRGILQWVAQINPEKGGRLLEVYHAAQVPAPDKESA